MAHKHCFEALDRTCRDIMSNHPNTNTIFRRKVIIFGGDFIQILAVVPKRTHLDIVHSSINVSYIWNHCEVLTLTKNMRLQHGSNTYECLEIESFSKCLLNIGEGKVSEPNEGYVDFDIPSDILLTNYYDPVEVIVQSIFPKIFENCQSYDYLRSRVILVTSIDTFDQINEHVLATMPTN